MMKLYGEIVKVLLTELKLTSYFLYMCMFGFFTFLKRITHRCRKFVKINFTRSRYISPRILLEKEEVRNQSFLLDSFYC